MIREALRPFFHPSSVAVIGASETEGKLGHEVLRNLIEGGFPGPLYPVNPKAGRILGLTCFKNVRDVPDDVDLAVMLVPARLASQAVRDCGEKGVKGAIVVAGGFSETGPAGEELQKELIRAASEYEIRLLGPNCQGVNNPHHPLCASWPLLTRKGRVAVISQSGTIGAAMIDWFSVEELGVSSFVSLGNRADIDEVDLIEYFENDPDTKAIAVYMEGIKDPPRFREVLRNRTKPLVILKSGRTPRGRVAAESHTRSLAGADAIYTSLFRQHGVCRAGSVEELYDFAKGFAYLKPPSGNRVLFITTSGGSAILATDAAERQGLDVSPLPAELAAQIEGIVAPHAIRANPLDLTGDTNAEMIRKLIGLARPYYDTVAVIFGDPIADASEAVTPDANEVVVFLGGAEVERSEKLNMHRRGIPVFPTPERAINALVQLVPPKMRTEKARNTFPVAAGRSRLGFYESLEFLESEGFDCIMSHFAGSPGKAVHLAHRMGFPVSLKVNSPDILHKSDCGGVRLNILSAPELREAYAGMMERVRSHHPDASIPGLVVSAMASPGLELIMGLNRDPRFGPVVIFGLGGITVELMRDVSMRLLPIGKEDALEMIREIKGAPLLKGFRGSSPVDENALAEGLLRLARIAREHQDIVEIDLNPVLAYPEGMVVVDARVLRA